MVKPSPFCVLDELDAPLDESNIGRFLTMLDKFIANSQFIIVTHNKRTMSRADVIYGVTMQEFGVSKPVGVRMTNEKVSLEDGQPTVADSVSGKSKSRKKEEGEAPTAGEAAATAAAEVGPAPKPKRASKAKPAAEPKPEPASESESEAEAVSESEPASRRSTRDRC